MLALGLPALTRGAFFSRQIGSQRTLRGRPKRARESFPASGGFDRTRPRTMTGRGEQPTEGRQPKAARSGLRGAALSDQDLQRGERGNLRFHISDSREMAWHGGREDRTSAALLDGGAALHPTTAAEQEAARSARLPRDKETAAHRLPLSQQGKESAAWGIGSPVGWEN